MSADRLDSVWTRLLNAFMGRKAVKTVDACARYWGVVSKVDGAKVDVTLDAKDIASPCGVPLFLGLPGTTVDGIEGQRVLVGFRDGDPSKPFVDDFEQASDYGAIAIGQDDPKAAAREGDPVNLGACYVTVGAGAVTAVFINGVALPIGADPSPPDRGEISGGSGTVGIGD